MLGGAFPLTFFEHNDFPLRGGGLPPNSAKEKIRLKQLFFGQKRPFFTDFFRKIFGDFPLKSYYVKSRNFHPCFPLQVACSVCVHGISLTFRQAPTTRLDFRGLYLLPLFKFLGKNMDIVKDETCPCTSKSRFINNSYANINICSWPFFTWLKQQFQERCHSNRPFRLLAISFSSPRQKGRMGENETKWITCN